MFLNTLALRFSVDNDSVKKLGKALADCSVSWDLSNKSLF